MIYHRCSLPLSLRNTFNTTQDNLRSIDFSFYTILHGWSPVFIVFSSDAPKCEPSPETPPHRFICKQSNVCCESCVNLLAAIVAHRNHGTMINMKKCPDCCLPIAIHTLLTSYQSYHELSPSWVTTTRMKSWCSSPIVTGWELVSLAD